MKIFGGLIVGLATCILMGCGSSNVDPPGGGDARQARKAEINGGSPDNPFPGQFASDPNAVGGAAGGDPDRM